MEKIISFGDNSSLLGIWNRPEDKLSGKPMVILVNSGVLHRVGPCRNTVSLARLLAKHGYSSFRFDYSGIGDSQFGSEALGSNSEKNVDEIKQAMDYFTFNHDQLVFVVHGLCSGARDALQVAAIDQRVVGVSQIDSYAYRNIEFYKNKLLPKIFNASAWCNSIRVRLRKKRRDEFRSKEFSTVVWDAYPPRRLIENIYMRLVERGVRFFVVYTGSWADNYNYEEQFFDLYSKANLRPCVVLKYLPDASHVMTDFTHKNDMHNAFVEYINSI